MSAPVRLPRGILSKKRADHVTRFIENLTLSTDSIASRGGDPFVLRPWQKAIVRELFGRMRADDRTRRAYRSGIIAIPRKNGKTELCAALALYGLIGDGVRRGQVYVAAAEKEQAGKLYDAAKAMVEADPELDARQGGRLDIIDSRKRIVDLETGSYLQVLSAEAYSKHGLNASMVIYDELHAAPNRDLWDVLRTSMGARREPLILAITTAGFDRTSICWEVWDYARKVRDGIIDDPEFFQQLYEIDEADDWTDERTWYKANPALGDFRDLDDMRALFRVAKHKAEDENTFRRLYLNQWTESEVRFFNMAKWRQCATADEAEAAGLPTYAGLDLGMTDDMSAFVGVTQLSGGRVLVRARIWMPDGARETFRSRPYASWQREGALTITDGDVTDFARLEYDILELCRAWNVVEIAYDKSFAEALRQRLEARDPDPRRAPALKDGVLLEQPQGYALNMGIRQLSDDVVNGTLAHNGNPVLTWMASNAVVDIGTKGDLRLNKRKARDKIDGIAALAMGRQRLMLAVPKKKRSKYEDAGLVTV